MKNYGILDYEKWFKHKPEPIAEAKRATILREFIIKTDRKIKTNRPAIMVKDYKRKPILLIDMSVPTENILVKEYNEIKVK